MRPAYNYTVCTPAFDILTFGTDGMDMLLGDSFLRNVFTAFVIVHRVLMCAC